MKFVIENYSNYSNTQPLYLNAGLNDIENIESLIYETNSRSLFDFLDIHKPDYLITHANFFKNDHMLYCKDNKNLSLILSVQDLEEKHIHNIDNILNQNNISCSLFFLNNNVIPKTKHRNTIRLLDCADSNLSKQKSNLKYKIDRAYVINKFHNIEDKNPYHLLSTNIELKDKVDICLPEIHLSSLYANYNEIIFLDIGDYIPQSFFDAILLGNKVSYISENKEINIMMQNVFKDSKDLKNLVCEKHTEKNRVKTLLSQLPRI
jgi:hypothetical protein